MSAVNDTAGVAAATEQGKQTALLHALLTATRVAVEDLAVGNMQRRELVLPDFPVAGNRRVIVGRTGSGADVTVAAATPVEVLTANEARLGGTICNYGANLAKLYLCHLGDVQDNETPATPTLALAAGSSWDLRLGNLLWCGSVVVVSTAGTILTVAEV